MKKLLIKTVRIASAVMRPLKKLGFQPKGLLFLACGAALIAWIIYAPIRLHPITLIVGFVLGCVTQLQIVIHDK